MDDLNDLYFFAAVVQHNGFSAAARATGVEKTRLSRRVAALEKRVGARLLQRSTRKVGLTEAGRHFHARCAATVESAQAAYDSIAELQDEPAGNVRMSCPVVLAQSYLAPMLAAYLDRHPKVSVMVEATNRATDLIEERFDLALRTQVGDVEEPGLVSKPMGTLPRILVASPAFLSRQGRPESPSDLERLGAISRTSDLADGQSRWDLGHANGQRVRLQVTPRLVTNDLRVQLEAAVHGLGIALLPAAIAAAALASGALAQVLTDWSSAGQQVRLVFPPPRGMLPSVRSLIDYLSANLPETIVV